MMSVNESKTQEIFSKTAQNKLKDEHKALLKEVWADHPDMVDYCLKEYDLLVKLDNEMIVAIKKPRIQTHFCFGYRLSREDTEEYDNASNMARYAARSQKYFIDENMKPLNEWVTILSDHNTDLYLTNQYYAQSNDILKKIEYFGHCKLPADMSSYTLVTDKHREVLLMAYMEEVNRFTKRLNTYLKRYGMSKVKTWPYWEDE